MSESGPTAKAIIAGLASAAFIYIFYLVFIDAALVAAVATSVIGGAFIAVGKYRQASGKRDYPDWFTALLAMAALVVYGIALAFLGATPRDSAEWLALAVLFALPLILLFSVYHRWKQGSNDPTPTEPVE